MIDTIRRFFGGMVGLTLDEADAVYLRMLMFLGFEILAILIAWLINIVGYPGVNLIFFFLFGAITLIIGYTPIYQSIAFGAGAVLAVITGHGNPRHISRLGVFVLKKYHRLVLAIAFGESILFFMLATWPLQSSPASFFYILAGVAMLGMIQYFWKIGGNFSRRLTYLYVLAIIVFAVFQTIPAETRYKLTGSYLGSMNPRTEKALADLENEKSRLADEKTAKKIQVIRDRIKAGIEPSESDLEFLTSETKKREKETIPSKISSVYETASESMKKTEKRVEKAETVGTKEALKTKVTKVSDDNGSSRWLVQYFPAENPGWVGPPALPEGKFKLFLKGNPGKVEGRISGGEKFEVVDEKEVSIPHGSTIEFNSEGGDVRITIQKLIG